MSKRILDSELLDAELLELESALTATGFAGAAAGLAAGAGNAAGAATCVGCKKSGIALQNQSGAFSASSRKASDT